MTVAAMFATTKYNLKSVNINISICKENEREKKDKYCAQEMK